MAREEARGTQDHQGGALAERVYRLVKQRILSGEMTPGSVLSENLLAKEFGVSRTPAREALHRLSLESLVESVPKRGTFVSPLPSVGYVRQLYELREAVAGMSARLAARRATADDIAELRKLVDEMEASDSLERSGELADRFIVRIDELSGNTLIASANRNLLDQIHRLRQTVMRSDGSYFAAALERRRQLVDALERGDGDAAERIAREIVVYVKQDAIRLLAEQ